MGKIRKLAGDTKTPERSTHVTTQKRISDYLKIVSNTKVKIEPETRNTKHTTTMGKITTNNKYLLFQTMPKAKEKTKGVTRDPSQGGTSREPSLGDTTREPSLGDTLREPSLGDTGRGAQGKDNPTPGEVPQASPEGESPAGAGANSNEELQEPDPMEEDEGFTVVEP